MKKSAELYYKASSIFSERNFDTLCSTARSETSTGTYF